MDKVVLVDNFPGAYMMHPKNALPVRSFLGDPRDEELLQVRRILKFIKNKNNVRPFLKRYRKHWTAKTYPNREEDVENVNQDGGHEDNRDDEPRREFPSKSGDQKSIEK